MTSHAQALSGSRKAAILLIALGEEAASSIYHHLGERDLQQITQEIAELEFIPPEIVERVLREYYQLMLTPRGG